MNLDMRSRHSKFKMFTEIRSFVSLKTLKQETSKLLQLSWMQTLGRLLKKKSVRIDVILIKPYEVLLIKGDS